MPTVKKIPVTKLVTQKPKPVKQVVLKNKVVFALDISSSIEDYGLTATVIDSANTWLEKIAKETKTHKQETSVSRVDFGYSANVVTNDVDISKFTRLNRMNYSPYGNTALFDGLTLAVTTAARFEKQKDTSILIIGITDGEENSSSRDSVSKFGDLISAKQAKGNYTVVIMLPPGKKERFCRNYNIPTENVVEWESTVTGLKEVKERTSKGIGNYFRSRSLGASQLNTFYSQTDASDLSSKTLKRQLDDIQDECQVFEIPREVEIADFVKSKIGDYRAKDGKAYYQLTKREEIQPCKQVLIMEKGKRNIYSGDEARELIGLHPGATDKVTPGNHANYDIFVNSTSTNRKLVRGTKLIVRN